MQAWDLIKNFDGGVHLKALPYKEPAGGTFPQSWSNLIPKRSSQQ